jgi:hypothetical protein
MDNRLQRQDFLAGIITEITESSRKTKKVEDEIIVDPNFKLSEDAKFGHELAKNTTEWYRYFKL